MLFSELAETAMDFEKHLIEIRTPVPGMSWYPYRSLTAIPILTGLIPPETEMAPPGGAVIDIGAADGDIGFLFHSFGCHVDFLENAPTNFNRCSGIRETIKLLGTDSQLIEKDIDLGFELERDYDLAIFLGALYHLRNPALPLIRLAQRCRTMLISTRVATHLPDGQLIGDRPVAYLLGRREANDDPTNWWIFTPLSLTRLLNRCGWNVVMSLSVGAVGQSNPVDGNADQRIYAYCERIPNHADLLKHHDF